MFWITMDFHNIQDYGIKHFKMYLISLVLGKIEKATSTGVLNNYDKSIIRNAKKKFEKKGKLEKANKQYEKARKLLIKSNNKIPNKPDTLNYLGFTTRKLGDFEGGEKYYLEGLAIDPKHIGINEYLGELYVVTKRHNLAVERLQVLKGCNCKEYKQLEKIIAGEEVSKY